MLNHFLFNFKELVFPYTKCLACRKPSSKPLCADCLENWQKQIISCRFCATFIKQSTLSKSNICCHCRTDNWHRKNYARAVVPYDKEIRNNIIAFKYYNKKHLARPMGALMAQFAQENFSSFFNEETPLLVPVPAHADTIKKRGYNQAELLADIIGYHLNLKVEPNALVRKKHTTSQTLLNRQARNANLANNFYPNPKIKLNNNIILIDDVFTTGATINRCAQILKRQGAKQVIGLCFAATIYN